MAHSLQYVGSVTKMLKKFPFPSSVVISSVSFHVVSMKKKTELLLSLVFSSACRMHAAVNLRLFVSFLLLLDVG